MFDGTVVGAAILDFFATSFFLDVDDLEVDAFLFGIVTVISLTGFDSRGWNAGCGLVACADCWLLVRAAAREMLTRARWCLMVAGWLRMKLRAGCLHAGYCAADYSTELCMGCWCLNW